MTHCRHTLILILALLTSTPLFAQLGHNWYQCNVSSGARSVLVERFVAEEHDGHIVAGAPYQSNADIYGFAANHRLEFGADGLLHRAYHYIDGEPNGAYTHYVHDMAFDLIKQELVVPKRKRRITNNIYTYFGKRKVLRTIKSKMVVLAYKDAIFQLAGRSRFALVCDSLNPKGQVVRSIRKQTNGGNAYTRINTYNHHGLLLKSVWTRDVYNTRAQHLAYVYKKEYSYRYTYNKRGDWTQAIIRLDGNPLMIAKRKIRYWRVAPRPRSKEDIDIKLNVMTDYLLQHPEDTKLQHGFQKNLRRFPKLYADMLNQLDTAGPKFKALNIYKEFMSQDARRHRYMHTYAAFASNLTGKDPVGIPRTDFEQIILPDLGWNRWKWRQVAMSTLKTKSKTGPRIKLYEIHRKGFKMIVAVNQLPASAENNLEVDYMLDGEATSHHCVLNGGECRVLCTGGADDHKVFRKVVMIDSHRKSKKAAQI